MNTPFDLCIRVGKRIYMFRVHVLYKGEAVVRFLLTIGPHEMKLQKKLLLKNNSWGILHSNFEFTRDDAPFTLLRIYRMLDEKMGLVKITYDQQKRNKD